MQYETSTDGTVPRVGGVAMREAWERLIVGPPDADRSVLLLPGGVVYPAGVVFHLAAHWRYARALWHSFVVIAAAIHYVAIMTLLQG